MRRSRALIPVAVAAVALAALTSCSDGGSANAADNGGYGECEVYGEAGSLDIHPVQDGVLSVQTNLPSPGWWKGETPDSITGGYEFCLAANIAHRAGLAKVKVENVSFDALVAGQTKDYDIAMAQISVTPERQAVVNFSEPYFDSNLGVLAPTDSDLTADNIGDKTVGLQVGTTAVKWFQDNVDFSQDPKLFQDTTTMVTAVSSGATAAAVQDTAIMLGFAKNSGGALKVIGQYETGEHYAAIYPKTSSNAEAMNEAVNAMRADGTLDKLSAKWLGPELGGDPATVPVWTLR